MKITKSLAIPILCVMGILALGTLLTGYFINMQALRTALVARENDKATTIHFIIQSMIAAEANKLSELALMLKSNSDLRAALEGYSESGGDPSVLRRLMPRFCPRMDDETAEITDAAGRIVYSSNPYQLPGFDTHLWGLDEALSGREILATTRDREGWAIRAYSPIVSEGKTHGVVIVGMRIDNNFAEKIAKSTNTQIMLAKLEEDLASTLTPERAGGVDHELIGRSLSEENGCIFVQNEKTGKATMYTSLKVVDETFCLVVQSDISSMYRLLEQKKRHLITASVATLLLVFVLGAALTTYLIKPLKRLRNKADDMIRTFSPDALPVAVQGNEIQTLVQAFDLMTTSINKYIDEGKDGQTALREQLHFLQTLIDSMPNPIFHKDAQGIYMGCNAAFEKFMGQSKDEIIGKSVYDLWPRDLADIYHNADTELLRQGGVQIYESSLVYADGTRHAVIFNKATFLKSDGSPGGLVGTIVDITDRKRAEQERMQLVAAIEQAAECIIITGKDGIVQYANPALDRVSGYGRHETIGQHVRIFRSENDDSKFYGAISGTLSRGESWTGHFTNRRKDGALYEVETTISPVRNESGDIANYVIVARDVTHEMRLERQLRQAQKMESMGRLAGGIAHDFNNILSAIIGFTDLALYEVPKESKAAARLAEVIKGGDRAKDLVKQILTFTRQSEQEQKPIEVAPLVKETLKFLRASLPATIEIRQNVTALKAVIMADPTQIHQVLMNLCTNAAQAMENDGGVLEVNLATMDREAATPPHDLDLDSETYVRLEVSDTGHGVDPSHLDQIFEPYFTTKPLGKGTGMGLAVVHGIVKSHGGVIEVHSEPGKGTRFVLLFPRVDQPGSQGVAPASVEELPVGTESILVVDDETVLTSMLRTMLEHLGYSVTTDNSPIAALKLFSERADEIDMVITDQTMPMLTGDGLARELLKLRPDVPIILTTGYSERISEEKAKAMGIKELLMKPVGLRALAVTVRRVLDERRPDTVPGNGHDARNASGSKLKG